MKKKILRALAYLFLGLLALITVGVVVVLLFFPRARKPTAMRIVPSAERLERGRYLAEHQLFCIHCHSEKDSSKYLSPVKPGLAFAGGECFVAPDGPAVSACPPNLTSDPETGLGTWTDDEISRAVREGVSRDGRALFPIMPWDLFSKLSDEDVGSIVVYLRSLPPIKKMNPKTSIGFPIDLMNRVMPEPIRKPQGDVPKTDVRAYGEYLANVSGCHSCHSAEQDYAGGNEFSGHAWVGFEASVFTPNITPDVDTGIGQLSKEAFIGRFQAMAEIDPDAPSGIETRTAMPWRQFSGMSEGDLGAIYEFLSKLPPIKNKVLVRP